jgi:glucose-fructose oxidoreductase
VYVAVPNHLHCEYTVRAAEAGVHALCEKPMAVTAAECSKMIHACETAGVKLMIAYRLHFEEANLQASEMVHSGQLGDVRLFTSVFCLRVKEGNIRLDREQGGGTLYDIGIYCINAARNIFRAEPLEVIAFAGNNGEKRFDEVEEMAAAVMKFPEDRLATFLCSFGTGSVEYYRVAGTDGDLFVEPAYHYAKQLGHKLTIGDKVKEEVFPKRDQFAPELVYFSNCVLEDKEPEPSAEEGLADVRIIEALYRSIQIGVPVQLDPFEREIRPTADQEMRKPAVRKPKLINTE